MTDNAKLVQKIEDLTGSKLLNPENFLVSDAWNSLLGVTGVARVDTLLEMRHLLFLPGSPLGDLEKQSKARIGAVLGGTNSGKTELAQLRLRRWTKRPVVVVDGRACAGEFKDLTPQQRVDLLLNKVQPSDAGSNPAWIAKSNYIVAVDELFLLLQGLDVQQMTAFCSTLFAKFDNGDPTPGSILLFADTSCFAGPLLFALQELKGCAPRDTKACVIRMDLDPLGGSNSSAVSDAKVLGAAFLLANNFSAETVQAFRQVETSYPARVLMLAEDIAKHEGELSAGGVVGAVVSKHISRDLAFYFRDLKVIVQALEADNSDDDWLGMFQRWLCRRRDAMQKKIFVGKADWQFEGQAHQRMLAAPPLEMALPFLLNLSLGSDGLVTSAQLERVARLIEAGHVPILIGAMASVTVMRRSSQEISQIQENLTLARLEVLSRATACMLQVALNSAGWRRIGTILPDVEDLGLKPLAMLIKANPIVILYFVRICLAHPEQGNFLAALCTVAQKNVLTLTAVGKSDVDQLAASCSFDQLEALLAEMSGAFAFVTHSRPPCAEEN